MCLILDVCTCLVCLLWLVENLTKTNTNNCCSCLCLCFNDLEEPPVVKVDRVDPNPSSNNPISNDPVLRGGTARIRCIPVTGIPLPALTWEQAHPPQSTVLRVEENSFITVSNVQADFCVNCIGISPVGLHSDQLCVTVRKYNC